MNAKNSVGTFILLSVFSMITGCASFETLPSESLGYEDGYDYNTDVIYPNETGVNSDYDKIAALDTTSLTLPPKPKGVYHKVTKKETLWRIAKTYNKSIKEIIESNNIPNVAQIEVNQLVFIPGATEVKKVQFNNATSADNGNFVWPLKGKILTHFHAKREGGVSRGIDIKARQGDIVKASRSGEVVFADYLPGQGHMIILDHADGFYTVYSRNAELLVGLGDRVNKNQPIAHVGQLDRLAYLHFQIRKNDKEDNPLYYLP